MSTPTSTPIDPSGAAVVWEPVAFADIPGWADDDHAAAMAAFLESGRRLPAASAQQPDAALANVCRQALERFGGSGPDGPTARGFFEARFVPHRLRHDGPRGLLTGYYEPIIAGSREPGGRFVVPLYRRPADLVNLVSEAERGARAGGLTHMRRLPSGALVPYPTRSEIEQGALAGQGLELAWFEDPVDVFFLQVQGSGLIRLPDASTMRVTYDGKNGYPYTSVGRTLIDGGAIAETDMSLQVLGDWLRADRERGRRAMWANASFAFFREVTAAAGDGVAGDGAHDAPLGVLGSPLHPLRSLAVDTASHALGTPIWVSAPSLTHADTQGGSFARLMVAHDVGSAIRGPERGDIFFGTGDAAGARAGITKHTGSFIVLRAAGGGAP